MFHRFQLHKSYPEANTVEFNVNQDGNQQREGVTEKQKELENLCTEQAAKIEQLTRLVSQFLYIISIETLISTWLSSLVTIISSSGRAIQTSN